MDEYFDKIARFLRDTSRLSFTGHKRTILRRRLETRLDQLNLPDFSAYWGVLFGNPAEEQQLYDLVTTNETSFFRNVEQFNYLHNTIIPRLEQRSGTAPRTVRVLSAGCSTGEEPYSIAMTILAALANPAEWRLEIVAGDISESCLMTARNGYYENDRLRKLPPGYRKRFMTEGEGGATMRDELKQIIRFIRLNLDDLMKPGGQLLEGEPGFFDIIFCRNVMIYFAPDCQQLLVDTLHRLLVPGGYLFTGDAEPLHLFRHEFSPVAAAGCLIYQKNGDTSQ
jgi:chemotaxis protein methyltransferase CheR